MKISIILPTLNESKNIKNIVNQIIKKFNQTDFEIIFVDDGSTDGTREEIKNIADETRIKYIFRNNDKDISRSFMEGLSISNGKYVILMDSDLQHDPIDLNKLYPEIENNDLDLIIGSRFTKESRIENTFLYKILRITSSRLFIFFIRIITKTKISDPLSGFFITKKDTINKFSSRMYKNGWKIMLDYVLSTKGSIKIKDVPINIQKREYGESKLNLKVVTNLILLITFHVFKNNS